MNDNHEVMIIIVLQSRIRCQSKECIRFQVHELLEYLTIDRPEGLITIIYIDSVDLFRAFTHVCKVSC